MTLSEDAIWEFFHPTMNPGDILQVSIHISGYFIVPSVNHLSIFVDIIATICTVNSTDGELFSRILELFGKSNFGKAISLN